MSQGVTPSQGSGQHPDSHVDTNNFIGGVALAVVALLLFLMTFTISTPSGIRVPTSIITLLALIFDPRILSIALGVLGVVTAFGLVPVRAPQDYYGGLVLVMLAVLAIIASADLPGQRGFAFGPGTAPRLFAGTLAALGIAVAVVGVTTPGPAIERYKLHGPLWVLFAISLFAAIIRPYGLIVAGYLAFLISIFGSTEMRWAESNVAASFMTIFCVVLFTWLLNLPFQLWPQPNAHVVLVHQCIEFGRLILGPVLRAIGVM